MTASISFSGTNRLAQPKFGVIEFHSYPSSIVVTVKAEPSKLGDSDIFTGTRLDTSRPDNEVTLNWKKLGTSETAQLLSQKIRDDKLSVKELKKGLLKILGRDSDLDTQSADPTALQEYNRVKSSIQLKIGDTRARHVKRLDGLNTGGVHNKMSIGDLRNCALVTQVEQQEANAAKDKFLQALRRKDSAEFRSLLNKKDIYGDSDSIKISPNDNPRLGSLPDRLLEIDDNFEYFSRELGGDDEAKSFIARILKRDIQKEFDKGIGSGQWEESEDKDYDTSEAAKQLAKETVEYYRG